MKKRVQEMEAEAEKLRQMQAEVEKEMNLAPAADGDAKEETDARSVYIGNVRFLPGRYVKILVTDQSLLLRYQVDYSATPEELQNHFQSCGTINRVTILCDKWTGHPKGYNCLFIGLDHLSLMDATDLPMLSSLTQQWFRMPSF
jgi:polyadenylate-binding protein 2